jgi:hypothetical protein
VNILINEPPQERGKIIKNNQFWYLRSVRDVDEALRDTSLEKFYFIENFTLVCLILCCKFLKNTIELLYKTEFIANYLGLFNK